MQYSQRAASVPQVGCAYTHALKDAHIVYSKTAHCFLYSRCVVTMAHVAVTCTGTVWSSLWKMVLFDSLRPKACLRQQSYRAWRLSRAELCTAQHQWCQSANLSGGLADGRLSETFDATLDESRWRQRERQSRSCAELPTFVFMLCSWAFGVRLLPYTSMGRAAEESGWGEERVGLIAQQRSWLCLCPLFFSDSHIQSPTPTLSLEWGSGPEL